MAKTASDLEVRVRAAYMRGRLRSAARASIGVLFCGAVGIATLDLPSRAWLVLVLLALTYGVLKHLGLAFARGARLGLWLGLVPIAIPFLVRTTGSCCLGGGCHTTCLRACLVAGVLTGLALVMRARRDAQPMRFMIGATGVIACAAGVGCVALDLGNFLGVLAGLVAATPLLAWRPATT